MHTAVVYFHDNETNMESLRVKEFEMVGMEFNPYIWDTEVGKFNAEENEIPSDIADRFKYDSLPVLMIRHKHNYYASVMSERSYDEME